ncbi:MAG: hypothetical protein ISS45_03710 [Candidatus Omnitrophica bacterium]|nr:hypothetical protein [Candidatus Omnitrophota bacterium]
MERNPVRAAIVTEASEYLFSSARFYCYNYDDRLTSRDPIFETFGSDLASRQDRYREFLKNFDYEEEQSFSRLERPQGNQEFINRLIKVNGRYAPRRRGRARERIVF